MAIEIVDCVGIVVVVCVVLLEVVGDVGVDDADVVAGGVLAVVVVIDIVAAELVVVFVEAFYFGVFVSATLVHLPTPPNLVNDLPTDWLTDRPVDLPADWLKGSQLDWQLF